MNTLEKRYSRELKQIRRLERSNHGPDPDKAEELLKRADFSKTDATLAREFEVSREYVRSVRLKYAPNTKKIYQLMRLPKAAPCRNCTTLTRWAKKDVPWCGC
jgi:hypothetical protein